MSDRYLPMQFRAYPDKQATHKTRPREPIQQILIFDTETTTDQAQRLLFGSAKLQTVRQTGNKVTRFTVREILFYADDLADFRRATFQALQRHAETHTASIDLYFPTYDDQEQGQLDIDPNEQIEFMSCSEFVSKYILKSGYSDISEERREYQPATIVGFNLSFDMWRLVTRVNPARGWFYGGLSGEFLNGESWTPAYREIKAGIGMKREMTGVKKGSNINPAYLVDMSELVRALTGKPHSLLSAGKAFGCRVLKYDGTETHDPEANSGLVGTDLDSLLDHYVGYNRNDVEATAELWEKAMNQFLRHPIQLRPDLTYSPASISKQYIRDMGIHAPMCACDGCKESRRGGWLVPLEVQGRAAAAFLGGRSECRVRMMSTPVVLCDFTSMYPTVMIRLGIWDLLTAQSIECREETTAVREFLDNLTEDDLYEPKTWTLLRGIADVIADRDLLPVRSPYADSAGSASGIGVNHVTTDKPVPWTLLDLAAAKLRTGRTPNIVTAWRFYPSAEKQTSLQPIKFYGEDRLLFDPAKDNMLKFLVEQRQIAKKQHKANKPAVAPFASNKEERRPQWEDSLVWGLRQLEEAGMATGGSHKRFLYPDDACQCASHKQLWRIERQHEFLSGNAGPMDMHTLMAASAAYLRKETMTVERARQQVKEAHANDNTGEIWNEDRDKCLCNDCEIERFLKVAANAVYGVFAEMNRHPRATPTDGTVYGLGGESWRVKDPEQPGEFCFFPFASLITGGARLMLAMLEHAVSKRGSSLVFCDTDSGCIPATKSGKSVPGKIRVLSYGQVNDIRQRFNRLNPYDKKIVPELLKWEKPDLEGDTRPLYASAISAKRYALYYLDKGKPVLASVVDTSYDESVADTENSNKPEVVKRSEHGLGLYMNPSVDDASNEKEVKSGEWYREVWEYIVARHVLGLDIPEPVWMNYPAVSRFPAKSLHIWNAFKDYNDGRPITSQVVPFNFFLAFTPTEVERRFTPNMRLVAPFEKDPRKWLDSEVIDVHTGERYRITVDRDQAEAGKVIAVKAYREVIAQYINHPEIKYDDSEGQRCQPETQGRLQPCHIIAMGYQHITKDSSSVTTAGEAFTHTGPHVYGDDSEARTRAIARLLIKTYGYSQRGLAEETLTSKKEAEIFLSKDARINRSATEQKYVGLAANLARAELKLGKSGTNRQVLAMWAFKTRERRDQS